MTADQSGTPRDAATTEPPPEHQERTGLRSPTVWTRATGAVTHLAFLAYLVAILLEPWRPGVRTLPLTLLGLGVLCGLLWLVAGSLAPRSDVFPEVAEATAPPTAADLVAVQTAANAVERRRAPWYFAVALPLVALVPALFVPFSGAHPEVSARQAELVAAGAQWGEYVLLPPEENGDRLPAYRSDQDYRFAPVAGTPGEPFGTAQSRSLAGVEVDHRVRLLTAPGQAPLAAPALDAATEPAPIERTAVRVWIGIVLLGTVISGASWTGLGGSRAVERIEEFYATGPQWHRIRVTGKTVTRDLPEEEIDRNVDGAPTTTEECLHLDLAGSTGHLLYLGDRPPQGLAWLGLWPELRSGTGSPRAFHTALIVPDRHGSYWGTVRPPLPTPVDAPAPRPRPVRPDPAHASLDVDSRLALAVLALWPIGWTAYHLLSPTDGTLPAWPAVAQLTLFPLALFLALVVLLGIGTGLHSLYERIFG
ncbi:hypothetical protein ACWCYY_20455 [Kitasatospora sp. NPDC001664]